MTYLPSSQSISDMVVVDLAREFGTPEGIRLKN
jgi:hypothetical protein